MNTKTETSDEHNDDESRVLKTEVERKFFVSNPPDLSGLKSEEILQGYIRTASDCAEVRVRQKGEKYFQTIKSDGGLKRSEVEIEISKQQFDSLWTATKGRRLKKTRYEIPYEGLTIEMDVYRGGLAGLVVAEVEFVSEDASILFIPPSWFGQELTDDRAFRNKNLAKKGMPSKAKVSPDSSGKSKRR
ncbi:MAG: CYTH domain-containing protein [Blastocatellia bacterium]